MRLTRLIATVSALPLLVLALAGACGGDDALSLEDYMARMDAIDKDVDTRIDNVFEEEAESARAFATSFEEAATYARDQYDAVSPPDEAKDAHEEIVSGIEQFRTALAAVAEDPEADVPAEDYESPFDDDLSAAEDRFNTAFCDIQKIADDNGIEADVGCDEEEGVDPSTLPAEEATEVLIEDFEFQPAHIQVSVGDTVTWTQGTDSESHTATADDDSFDSDALPDEGDTFEFTFDEAGEFSYFCEIHPEMLGLVTVVE